MGSSAQLRALVVDALERTAQAAAAALTEETDGFAALVRYTHAALDARVSAVIPVVLDVLGPEDEDLRGAREASAELVQRIVDQAYADGSLPADVTFGDIGTLLVRLGRPLPDSSHWRWTRHWPTVTGPARRGAAAIAGAASTRWSRPGARRPARTPGRATAVTGVPGKGVPAPSR
ncbi:hypothetical protein [Geodermatophilus normandii]|uniref:TetR family transcriptional regulator n=1 Tax=Geodermatophilus normandii TaxID=1137989 RepID=A0A6P0GKY8_9ACTN|nr:hypothetical protein [Geodermatophilus normandii]NEM08045.1 hypothetical protein [Geodermatophilus normandii]